METTDLEDPEEASDLEDFVVGSEKREETSESPESSDMDEPDMDSSEDVDVDDGSDSLEAEGELGESPEASDDKAGIRIGGSISNSRLVVVGENLYEYNFFEKGIKVASINPVDVKKIQSVYVESTAYVEGISKLSKSHLLVLTGKAHTGKRATALRISQYLISKGISSVWTLRCTDDASLADFLEDEDCPRDSVIIAHDAFVFTLPGLNYAQIEHDYSSIELLLQRKNNYIILTSDISNLPEERELPHNAILELPGLDNDQLVLVLENHIKYYNLDYGKQVSPSQKKEILSLLHHAYQIDRLCEKIADLSFELNKTNFLQLLGNITNVEIDAKRWFSPLEPFQKYYAMLVGLFQGIDSERLRYIYDRMIDDLRAKKVKLDVPLTWSEEDLQSATETVTSLRVVEFKTPLYRDYVLNQVRVPYRQQFRSLLPLFSQILLDYSFKNTPDNIDTRLILASAIGEIGKSSWDQVLTILEDWARDGRARIRVSASYALRRIASDPTQLPLVMKTIKSWRKHGNPRFRWTSAASLERLYPYMGEKALENLTLMAGDREEKVAEAIIHAFVSIARRDIEVVIDWLLTHLVTSEKETVRKVCVDVFLQILNDNRRGHIYINRHKLHVLPLISELLRIRPSDGLAIIKPWVELYDAELDTELEKMLMAVCENVKFEVRQSILQILENDWSEPVGGATHRFAAVVVDMIKHLEPPSTPGVLSAEGIAHLETDSDKEDSDKSSLKGLSFEKMFGKLISSKKSDVTGKSDFPDEPSDLKGSLAPK